MRPTPAVLLAALVCAGPAAAQVVTPPEAPKPEMPEYVPPPPPEPAPPPAPPLTEIEYDSLVVRDDEGRVVRLTRPVGLEALPRNPLIGEDQWERIGEVLEARKERLQGIAVDNTDIMLAIENGVFDQIRNVADDNGRVAMESARELIQPILEPLQPHQELVQEGVLTDRQGRMTDLIMREYQSVLLRDVADGFEPEPGSSASELDGIVRSAFEQQVAEVRFEFRRVLLLAAGNLDDMLIAAGMTAEDRDAVSTRIRSVKGALTDEGRIGFMVELLSELDTDRAEALMRAAADLD